MTSPLPKLIAERASGVFRCAPLPGTGSVVAEATEIALHKARDKNAFLDAFAHALRFPAHFGHNWDAFYDCLGDVGGSQRVLLLRHASAFARAEPEEFATAVDTLADAVDLWREAGRSLLVIVELDAPVLAPELGEVSLRPG